MQNTFNLISVTDHNGTATTTSLNIAKVFGKTHYDVLKDIRRTMETIEAVSSSDEQENLPAPLKTALLFEETTYTSDQGKVSPMFLLNRDATTFLIMGYTGKKAVLFKLGYIAAFNSMEAKLKAPTSAKLPDTHISNVNYDACDKLISEYKKALDKPSDTGSIAAAKLKGKILKMAVGFDPVEEYDKQWNFEAKAYNDKCIADMKAREKAEKEWEAEKKRKEAEEHNPYKNPDIDDSLYDDVPF